MKYLFILNILFIAIIFSSCYSRGNFGTDTKIFNETTQDYYNKVVLRKVSMKIKKLNSKG